MRLDYYRETAGSNINLMLCDIEQISDDRIIRDILAREFHEL